jgi:DNA-directed RNA polymerase specialized sigma24 family protein
LYLARASLSNDHSFLDDVLQDIMLIAFEGITGNKFTDMTPDSFRKWLYTIAHNQCIKQTQEKFKEFKPLSQVFPDDEKGISESQEGQDDFGEDDLMVRIPEGDDYDTSDLPAALRSAQAGNRAEEILSQLSLEEQKLMRLLSQGKSYKEIQEHPWFKKKKYSIDYLMRKVYKIRQKVYKLSAKGETSPKGGQKRKKGNTPPAPS